MVDERVTYKQRQYNMWWTWFTARFCCSSLNNNMRMKHAVMKASVIITAKGNRRTSLCIVHFHELSEMMTIFFCMLMLRIEERINH